MSYFLFRLAVGRLTSVRGGEYAVHDGVVSCTCPQCGAIHSLAGHSITEKGIVSPSLVCPRCDWHQMARLEGWGDA